MADRRGAVLSLIILAFIFLSPEPPLRGPAGQVNQRPAWDHVVAQERRALSALQSSTWESLPTSADGSRQSLNLTGLEVDRGYAWDALPAVKARAKELLRYSLDEYGLVVLEGEQSDRPVPPLYANASGHVFGKWIRSALADTVAVPQLNLSAYAPDGPFGPGAPKLFKRNITGTDGDVRIRFRERVLPDKDDFLPDALENVTRSMIDLTIHDRQNSMEHELEMFGFHFVHLGQAILTTTSSKFAGVFMSPNFALSRHTFDLSKAFMNASLTKTIRNQEDHKVDAINPWSTDAQGIGGMSTSEPECELIIYLQQLPVWDATAPSSDLLALVEDELRFPTGANLPSMPELRFSMVAFSPDCGYVLESKGPPDFVAQNGNHLAGPKLEVLHASTRHHLLVFSLTLGAQLVLLLRQMREASTPSTRSRLSLYSVAILALGDGFTTMTFVLFSFFIPGLWVNLMTAGFLACISVMFFGMRFMMDIWAVQEPERVRRAREEAEAETSRRERLAATLERLRAERRAANGPTPSDAPHDQPVQAATANPPTVTRPSPRSLPPPVTAPVDTGASPVFFMPSDQDGQETIAQTTTATPTMTSFGTMYTRFYLLLLGSLLLSLNAASWSSTPQRIYFTSISFLYLSFWCPQISRNVQRNCRKALTWEFVAGQSLLRLVPFVYFYAYKHNVLFTPPDYSSLALLIVWLWIQVLVLASQEVVGPRWFIRKGWAPPAYDYHPILREDEEGGAALPLGASMSSPTSPLSARRGSLPKDARQKGKRVFDCAICMQDLEVPVVEPGAEESVANSGNLMLARRLYMVTPCRHVFHSACLEGWMKYRLQCPNCREALPAL
nr:dsc e3 ubiquitin ligase complex subunit 1 [Quercus suber]